MGAIPTFFDGIEFRSRLEARWAAFFTNIGWQWTYEPFDGEGYIPDFTVTIAGFPCIIEVKPAVTEQDYLEPWEKILNGLPTWHDSILVVGVNPLPIAGFICVERTTPFATQWTTGNPAHSIVLPVSRQRNDDFVAQNIVSSMWADACNQVKWRGRKA